MQFFKKNSSLASWLCLSILLGSAWASDKENDTSDNDEIQTEEGDDEVPPSYEEVMRERGNTR